MSHRLILTLLSCVWCGLPGASAAQAIEPESAAGPTIDLFPETPPAPRKWAVTVSLIPLVARFPVLELSGEHRLSRNLGVAAMLGAGELTLEGDTFSFFEVGSSLRYYLLGNYQHGMQLGVAVEYAHLSGEVEGSIPASGNGLFLAPFLGYKYTFGFGLVGAIQLGRGFLALRASADKSDDTASRAATFTYANLDVGWAF